MRTRADVLRELGGGGAGTAPPSRREDGVLPQNEHEFSHHYDMCKWAPPAEGLSPSRVGWGGSRQGPQVELEIAERTPFRESLHGLTGRVAEGAGHDRGGLPGRPDE